MPWPTPTYPPEPTLAPSITPVPTPVVTAPAPGTHASFDQMIDVLQAFARQSPGLSSQAYLERISDLRRRYQELQSQDAAVAAAAPVIGYYETVGAILTYKEHAKDSGAGDTGQRLEGSRRQTDVAYNYGGDGPVPVWVERYGFIAPAIVREPLGDPDGWELAGRWLPDQAIRILLERAKTDTDALARGAPAQP